MSTTNLCKIYVKHPSLLPRWGPISHWGAPLVTGVHWAQQQMLKLVRVEIFALKSDRGALKRKEVIHNVQNTTGVGANYVFPTEVWDQLRWG